VEHIHKWKKVATLQIHLEGKDPSYGRASRYHHPTITPGAIFEFDPGQAAHLEAAHNQNSSYM